VNDLRDAARAGAGRFEIERSCTDLAILVARVVQRHRQRHPDREILLSGPDAVPMTCDRERIDQVIGNLISNALKYSPADSSVSVNVRVDGRDAIVGVTDRGIGIPEEERDRLFQPFSRLPGAQGFAGTGLGLFISHAVVEAHGGTIDVVSAEGEGSTFTVLLPGAIESAADAAVAGTALA
jgi:signal transduction histidine kinase